MLLLEELTWSRQAGSSGCLEHPQRALKMQPQWVEWGCCPTDAKVLRREEELWPERGLEGRAQLRGESPGGALGTRAELHKPFVERSSGCCVHAFFYGLAKGIFSSSAEVHDSVSTLFSHCLEKMHLKQQQVHVRELVDHPETCFVTGVSATWVWLSIAQTVS